ncbi:MAG: amidohydrolase [Firmicutes bacterium]|nr:amidohydrolase [Bacillota bacterium]
MDCQAYLKAHSQEILATWRTLHDMPEVAFSEKKTSAYLAEELRKTGFVIKHVAKTGVLGIFDSGKPGPSVAARADMDALLHQIDGQERAVHSCGHDANCTAVLWAAKSLVATDAITRGSLQILFQPAEETLEGAKACIKEGVLSDVEYLIGTHLRPAEELPLGSISPAVLHGASGILKMTVEGQNAHGARPQQGVNAVEAAIAVITGVYSLHFDPMTPHSIKVTQFRSGPNPHNVIPDKVELAFDMRAQTNELLHRQIDSVRQRAEQVATAYSAKASCYWKGGVRAAIPCEELIGVAQKAIVEVLGQQGLGPVLATSGGEDMHEFIAAYPCLKSTILGVGADLTPGLHQADMTFDKRALLGSAQTMAELLARLVNEKNK